MKAHTNDFKNAIKLHGKQLDSKITYSSDGETIELGVEQLNSIASHYEGGILKSVMRGLSIDSNVEIPKGTVLNFQFGVLVGNSYEYIDFGNYVVNTIEKKEDTNSYSIECCDKMLYSMVDYDSTNITYPITIRNYINAICTKIGLTFKNANDTFVNYDKEIPNELYSNIGYTFRDVLDELAQVTASTICINESDDELEIRYIGNEQQAEYLLKDMEEQQDVSNMVFTMDTIGYTSEQLIDGIGNMEIGVFGSASEGEWIILSNGQTLTTQFSSFNIYTPDGTIFEDIDNSHMYLLYFKYHMVNQEPRFESIYILNDLTSNIKYGDLQFEDNTVLGLKNTENFQDSVIWNCMKVLNIEAQQMIINEEYLKDINVNFG